MKKRRTYQKKVGLNQRRKVESSKQRKYRAVGFILESSEEPCETIENLFKKGKNKEILHFYS